MKILNMITFIGDAVVTILSMIFAIVAYKCDDQMAGGLFIGIAIYALRAAWQSFLDIEG